MSIRTLLLITLLSTPLLASQEPPPVRLKATTSGTIRLSHPFLVNLTVTNLEATPQSGTVSLQAPPGLTIAPHLRAAPILLSPTSTRTLSFALTPTHTGLQEFDLHYSSGSPLPRATLRLFVQLDARGAGRVLTLSELLDAQTSRVVRGTGNRKYRLFTIATQLSPAAAPRTQPGDVPVSGMIQYKSFKGDLVPGRRITVEIWTDDTKRELVVAGVAGADGKFQLTVPATHSARKLRPTFTLRTPRWTIQSTDDKVYGWEAPVLTSLPAGGDLGTFTVPAGQAAAEACWIHTTLNLAQDVFTSFQTDLTWWTSIPANWPASGDYFDGYSVNLTKAQQWDVVGHEFGHAVFGYGTSAVGSGGAHKIDECYSKALAWSEGWASYFAAVIQIARDDADAKFEFMVPRRAPIRIENVPADVCKGQTNEWRVGAALWDLFDTHQDTDDTVSIDFPTMWQAMRNGNYVSDLQGYIRDLKPLLPAASLPEVDKVLKANTIE